MGAALLDGELRIVAANETLARLLHVPAAELPGRAWRQIAAADAPDLSPLLRQLWRGETARFGQEVRCRRGRVPDRAGVPPAPGSAGVPRAVQEFWAWITVSVIDPRPSTVAAERALLLLLEDVDLRKRSELRLRASEREYRVLFEKNLAGVYRSSLAGRILDCNDAFAAMFGFASRQEALLSRAQDFYLAPEHRERWLGLLRDRGALNSYEAYLRRKDGSPVWVLANEALLPVAHGQPPVIQGTMIDISARKASEEALRRERDFVSAVVDSATMLVLVISPDGAVERFSKGAEAVTGFAAAALMGQPYWRFLLPPERQPQALRFLEDVRSGLRPERLELDCLTRLGKSRRIAWSLSYLDGDAGGLAHIVATGVDVTEHRRLEGQFRQAQKMEAIGQLAGGISHDFNNLLTVITGHCDLLLSQAAAPGGPPPLERVAKIKAAADRAVALTRQLLAFSRAQTLEPRTVALNEIIARSQEMLRPLLGEQVVVRSALAEDLGLVHADPVQLEQVLMNLAINARDAMPAGGTLLIETVNVELDDAYVRLRPMVKTGPYVLLAVSDSGTGMDAATQARIFEPFFTTKEQGRGTGLGLATVYGIVKQSRGYIWVYSEVGRGTSFKIYLPRIGRPAAKPAARSAPPPRPSARTVLLVEDDAEVRQLARELLEAQGLRVLAAEAGVAAMKLAEQCAGPIHLLLTDANLPGLSGRELAGRIRARHGDLKVLYTSGFTPGAMAQHGVVEDGAGFVAKPFTAATLLRQVRAALA